jgi:hypothetical protein
MKVSSWETTKRPVNRVTACDTVGLRGYLSGAIALQCGMPALTRRRSTDAREECWHIYYGDVRVGTIARRVGNPFDTDPWQWTCGFYPGSHPREHQTGTSETFEQARTEFEAAWAVFLSKRTEADFQEWRDQRDWMAEKYRRFDRGERMPPDWKPPRAAN